MTVLGGPGPLLPAQVGAAIVPRTVTLGGGQSRNRRFARQAMLTRLQLKSGVDPNHAFKVLGEQLNGAASITPSVGFGELQNRFLDWAESCERQLHYLTDDRRALTMFDTARARMIRELGPEPVRPWPLVDAEVTLQVSVLTRMREDLEARLARAQAPGGHAVVVDTNLLLHYRPLDQLPWPELVGVESVRLILPLRVIEELDQKKYAARSDLAWRARRLLPQLRAMLGPGGAPARIRPSVSLEVALDPGPRWRPADADEEILAACRELAQFGAQAVSLASADTAMALRAEADGIAVVELDESLRREADARQENR